MTDNTEQQQSESPKGESVRVRLPLADSTPEIESEFTVDDSDCIAVTWHQHGGIGDGLEVFPGDNTDEQLVLMRDILGYDNDVQENVYGPLFEVSAEELNQYEFTSPEGDDLSPESVAAIAQRTTKNTGENETSE